MTDPNLWNQLLIWPITNLLIAFYKFCDWLPIPWPMAWAVVLMTIAIRLALYPLMQAQLKSAKKMSDLKPKLDEINKLHKGDKQALQQAQMNLYKEHGVNPAAGCLPLLVQMPFLIALYNVFYQVLSNGNMQKIITDINQIVYLPALKISSLDMSFLGTNLGIKPSQWQTGGWWLLSIPLITGGLQWYQTKLMTASSQNSNQVQNQKPKGKAIEKTEDKKEEKPEGDTAAEMQKQMAIISPIMFAFFSWSFPLGLALYWNVFGLFGIMQQLKVNKERG